MRMFRGVWSEARVVCQAHGFKIKKFEALNFQLEALSSRRLRCVVALSGISQHRKLPLVLSAALAGGRAMFARSAAFGSRAADRIRLRLSVPHRFELRRGVLRRDRRWGGGAQWRDAVERRLSPSAIQHQADDQAAEGEYCRRQITAPAHPLRTISTEVTRLPPASPVKTIATFSTEIGLVA